MEELHDYVKLLDLGQPDFIEIKGALPRNSISSICDAITRIREKQEALQANTMPLTSISPDAY